MQTGVYIDRFQIKGSFNSIKMVANNVLVMILSDILLMLSGGVLQCCFFFHSTIKNL